MSNKKAELTIETVILLILGLIILSVSIYLIYTHILKPSETGTSLLTCQSRGGIESSDASCSQNQPCALCLKLPKEGSKDSAYCCIKDLKTT
ncbi:MAG TPA: hypothetical protein VKE88_03290 [Candidatus Nanoarchaeia archaeon]|nr:hypothetical protein [Candidatus Nanoarchaeia archaeon]